MILPLVLLAGLNLVFALRTNVYFSQDDFAVLVALRGQSPFGDSPLTSLLIRGDPWGFHKITGYAVFKLNFSLFGTNPVAFLLTNHLLHTANLILFFLLVRHLTQDKLKAFFFAVIFNGLYLTYFSNIHEILVTFLVLLSAYLFLTRPGRWGLSWLVFLAALLTKELAIFLPLLLLVLKPNRQLIPFFILSGLYLLFQGAVRHPGTVPLDHPYAITFYLPTILHNLTFYLSPAILITVLSIPILLLKFRPTLILLVALLSLAPALLLKNRQELYYLYLPLAFLLLYLGLILPRFSLPTLPVYLVIFIVFGGRQLLPPLARQNYPNWQKVSIENVLTRVGEELAREPDLAQISLAPVFLERDAKLMLGSQVIDLFLPQELSSRYQFTYNADQHVLLAQKTH